MMNTKFDHIVCEKESKLFDYQKKKNITSLNANDNLFSMVLPPPNLTGILHVGHAWNCSVQDFIFRHKTMSNYNAIWFSGMDHAGIATQTKYESHLKSINQKDLLNNKTRQEKISLVNDWAQSNADKIRQQWKELGLFLDYENERFTLDKDSNELVINTFVDLYKKGLIYRGKKLVNWDVKLKTAVSNIEVIKKEVNKKMYYIKYYFEDKKDYLTIATTRPETIFVDVVIFVHPEDKRYKNVLNKKVINPLTNKLIPILTDEYIDKEFGTGVMKCTPAHDFNDYDLGKKHNLTFDTCINYDGTMNENAPGYTGIDRLECCKKVVEFFKQNNLLVKEEETISNVGFSERSDEIIEPLLSEQWFIKMKPFADIIIKNQESKNKLVIYPIKFEKTLINWVSNIEDWCISRQLWWGHQIPAWYNKKTNEVYVNNTPPKDIENWVQDTDVLDTWFSSGLWPITCTTKQQKFFPTDILVTGYDIIFFWVVRMLSFSLHIKNQIPFKSLYVTGLIRDEQGRKMSKSLGNGVDPQQVIKEKGADTLRLMLLSSSSPGEDIKFSMKKLDSCWAFLNKLWNSYRYILEHKNNYKEIDDFNKLNSFDKWIIKKFFEVYNSSKANFEKYNLLVGINKIVDFVKNEYCNTYLELNKKRMANNDSNYIFVLFYIMKHILVLLHPVCPYITDYLYNLLPNKQKESIIFETNILVEPKMNVSNDLLIIDNALLIIEKIRTIRFDNKLSKKDVFEINLLSTNNTNLQNQLNSYQELLDFENIKLKEILNKKPTDKDIILNDFSIELLTEFSSSQNRKEELLKELEKLKSEIIRSENILNNQGFLSKAPKEKIDVEKQKYEQYKQKMQEIEQILQKM